MKKILVTLTSIMVLASCASANTGEKAKPEMKHQKEIVLMNKEMKHKEEKLELSDEENNKIVLVSKDGFESGVLTINGADRNVKRVVTASGMAFETADREIYFAMKGSEGFLELNGKRSGGTFILDNAQTNLEEEINLVYQNRNGERLHYMGNGNDKATVVFRGKEYKLSRIVTASGLAFNSNDGRVFFSMKGNEANLEIIGIKENFLLLNKPMMHNDNMDKMNKMDDMKKEMKHEMMDHLVYQSTNGDRLHFMARANDTAVIVFKGKEYKVSRVVTASGTQYRTREGLLDFSTKGNEGFLRIGGTKIDFTLVR